MPALFCPGVPAMNEAVLIAAAHWHLQSAGEAMDWDGFTAWLEADPAHAAAYDAIALDDVWIADHAAAIRQGLDEAPASSDHAPATADASAGVVAFVRRKPVLWIGSATGLAAAAMLSLVLLPHDPPAPGDSSHSYAAPADGMRTLALGDGVKVVLSHDARLIVPDTPGAAMRLTGTAYFNVAHRPDRLLKIQAGGYTISDIGTRFEIANTDTAVRVSVEEGAVSLSRQATDGSVRLMAGQGAMGYHQGGAIERLTLMPQSVGSFRRGILVYQNAPLDIVADEISRYAGVPVRVDAALGQRRFSGALTIGSGRALPDSLAELMDLKASERNGTILLSAAPGR